MRKIEKEKRDRSTPVDLNPFRRQRYQTSSIDAETAI